jgi:hypothetical protein
MGEWAMERQSVSAQERVDILSPLMGVIQFHSCLTMGNTLNRRVAHSPHRRVARSPARPFAHSPFR